MDIYRHYQAGTVHITSDGDYKGYYPDRDEQLLAINIKTDEYTINIFYDAITIHHKYISLVYEHSFTVGRKTYPIASLCQYNHNERKRLVHMDDTLRMLINEHTVGGIHINDYYTMKLINTHQVDQD